MSNDAPPVKLDTRAFSSSVLPVQDPSHVGAVRRYVNDAAGQLGFGDVAAGQLAIVATEAATNLLKHAGGGELVLRALRVDGRSGLELIALDKGPGIGDIAEALRDGPARAGSLGGGLGAMRRLSDVFEVFSNRGGGTAVLSQSWTARPGRSKTGQGAAWLHGGVCAPKPGEPEPGDAWAAVESPAGLSLLVADGLGHGQQAREAALAAVEVVRARPAAAPAEVIELCYDALRATRGAAVAMAQVDPEAGSVRFAGIGNITGIVASDGQTRSMVSLNGIVGHGSVKIRQFSYEWRPASLLVLASDGLATRWTLDAYRGLASRHPSLIGGILYRDHCRGNDDVSVIAVKAHGRGDP